MGLHELVLKEIERLEEVCDRDLSEGVEDTPSGQRHLRELESAEEVFAESVDEGDLLFEENEE